MTQSIIRGDLFRMTTGELVEVTFTRCYETPQGDTLQHAVRLVEPHKYVGTREVGERVVYETALRPRGTVYHLTTSELFNNGRRASISEIQQRAA